LAAARRPSKRLNQLLAVSSLRVPKEERLPRRYLITDNDVVFVLGVEDVIITVMRLSEAKRRARRLRREMKRRASG